MTGSLDANAKKVKTNRWVCFSQHISPEIADNNEEGEQEAVGPRLKKKKQTNLFTFLSDHPLFSSHATHCAAPGNGLVPNFIGPSLPRVDQGDREYYCMTMLMFFKPYRTGKELKANGQSWDEAFNEHPFTPQQCQLMLNFNLKYECLDARDNFHVQLWKGASVIPFWDSVDGFEIVKELDQQRAMPDDFQPDNEGTIDISSAVGYWEQRRRAQVSEMDKVLRCLGWDH